MRFLLIVLAVLLGPMAICFALGWPIAAWYALGGSCVALGAFGIWLAMVSPVQLQPIPLCLLLLGIVELFIVAVVT